MRVAKNRVVLVYDNRLLLGAHVTIFVFKMDYLSKQALKNVLFND